MMLAGRGQEGASRGGARRAMASLRPRRCSRPRRSPSRAAGEGCVGAGGSDSLQRSRVPRRFSSSLGTHRIRCSCRKKRKNDLTSAARAALTWWFRGMLACLLRWMHRIAGWTGRLQARGLVLLRVNRKDVCFVCTCSRPGALYLVPPMNTS